MPGPLPILTTARLSVRPLRLSDASDVQRLAGNRAVAEMTLLIPHPYPDGAAEQWITMEEEVWTGQRGAAFAIELRSANVFCGAIGLRLEAQHQRAELGYWLGVPYWGKGYATEAGHAIVRFGFETFDLRRIYAHHFTRNPLSGRVLKKLGMTYEGRLRQHVRRDDRFEDLECYGLLRQEWAELHCPTSPTSPGPSDEEMPPGY